MNDNMNPIWLALAGFVILAAMVAGGIGTYAYLNPSATGQMPAYADACVVTVTHPQLCVELYDVQKPGAGCSFCRYIFRVWNETAPAGTKAYDVKAMVVTKPSELTTVDGKTIEVLKLQGFVQDLRTVNLGVVKDRAYFAMDGLCADCMFPGESAVTLIVEYYECDGVRRAEVACDLRSKSVSIIREVFEPGPCSGCGK